jgi:hypothetical protein
MTDTDVRGISCAGLDDAFRAEQTRKSNLLLEGQLLEAQGQFDAAAENYAAAAAIEERLHARCLELGLRDKAWIHQVSAVSCWAGAGNLYTALRLGDELLANTDLPDHWRARVQPFLDQLRARRRAWSEQVAATRTATAVPA